MKKEEELLPLHGLFYIVAEYLDIDLDESDYSEQASPSHAHKSKEAHKEAIATLLELINEPDGEAELISSVLGEDSTDTGADFVSGSTAFDGYELSETGCRRDIIYFNYRQDNRLSVPLARNGPENYGYRFLRGLSEGMSFEEAIGIYDEERYARKRFGELNEAVLEDGTLPGKMRGELGEVLEHAEEEHPDRYGSPSES